VLPPTGKTFPLSVAIRPGEVGRCKLTLSKPKLKAPGTKRLKLNYVKPLSRFAFNFNLRRYGESIASLSSATLITAVSLVGRCWLTLSTPC